MNYEVIQDKRQADDWRVEACDMESGECYVAIFSGQQAEERAREYAGWKAQATTGGNGRMQKAAMAK